MTKNGKIFFIKAIYNVSNLRICVPREIGTQLRTRGNLIFVIQGFSSEEKLKIRMFPVLVYIFVASQIKIISKLLYRQSFLVLVCPVWELRFEN